MLILKSISGIGTYFNRGKKGSSQDGKYELMTDGSAIVHEDDNNIIVQGDPEEYYELKSSSITKNIDND